MTAMWYPAILKREGGHVLVEFPDFPEAHTYGDDVDEALERARDALATVIDAYIRDRDPIPEPSPVARGTRGMRLIRIPALTQAKIDLYQTMRDEHVTKTDLARRLGWHLPQVDRLLDVTHASRLDQLESAFGALGKEMQIWAVAHGWSGRRRTSGMKGGALPSSSRRGGGRRPATKKKSIRRKAKRS